MTKKRVTALTLAHEMIALYKQGDDEDKRYKRALEYLLWHSRPSSFEQMQAMNLFEAYLQLSA